MGKVAVWLELELEKVYGTFGVMLGFLDMF